MPGPVSDSYDPDPSDDRLADGMSHVEKDATIADLRRQLAERRRMAEDAQSAESAVRKRLTAMTAERDAAREALRKLSKVVKSMQTGCCETCGEIPECFGGKCNCDLVVGHRRRGG